MSASASDSTIPPTVSAADKFAIESYLNHVFPDSQMLEYFFDTLRPENVQIWYGTGNNGKTALRNIISANYPSCYGKLMVDLTNGLPMDGCIVSDDMGYRFMTIFETNTITKFRHRYCGADEAMRMFWSHVRPIVFEQKDMRSFPLSVEEVAALPWAAYLKRRLYEQKMNRIDNRGSIDMPSKSSALLALLKTASQIASIETYLNYLFKGDNDMQDYFFDSLQAALDGGKLMVWYGTGNNGKSVFQNIILDNRKHNDDSNVAIAVSNDTKKSSKIYDCMKRGDSFMLHVNTAPTFTNPPEGFWDNVRPIVFENNHMDTISLSVKQVEALPWYDYLNERLSERRAMGVTSTMPKKSKDLLEMMKAKSAAAAVAKATKAQKPVLNVVEDAEPKNTVVFAAPSMVRPREPEKPVEPEKEDEDVWAYADIVIRLKKADRTDDVLTISPDYESDNFIVSFEQPDYESWVTMYMPPNKLNSYISTFFSSTTWDSNPYTTVEFDVPFFPLTAVDQDDAFDYATRNLLPQIALHLDDWPVLTEFADDE